MARTKPFDDYLNEYEEWFEQFKFVYESELQAVNHFIPKNKKGIEIGIGTGRFALPLKISEGIEPSKNMREFSLQKGLKVYDGVAENLPLDNDSYDFVLMVTTICFVDDIKKAFAEVKRILKPGGIFIIGLVDKNSPLGKTYEKLKDSNKFYRYATFYSVEEVRILLEKTGFVNVEFVQTVFGELSEIKSVQHYKTGHGEGGFVVIRVEK
ncbi:MAG TPA: class I SAM-dependent methyltransferase [Ignavibacteriaceae bacterium]|jgi:ubiquinone/menaquinone biosynthesis C-methylase UbiE|nr:MAG: Demethylmenaquinone methyltransferase [Ignavibacteria bacterium ADurb.Bin266]OQY73425.1 MAG: SAM-dependent methyltransferase [Ignavibacteriales bacterium UTCHB2]HQF42869.1 class I SAM-dependent methyltransferase [Ignavibacteriaceae bacterium]HQI40246.1 class I SAM-dependent methyltransferase [Ignavibacteriaceae bacterium]